MAFVRTDTSPSGMIEAIQADLSAAWAGYASGPGGRLWEDDRISCVYTGLPVPIYNAVTRFRYDSADADAAVADVLGRFRAADVPCTWWLGPQTRPEDIDARLQAHRPAHVEQLPGMAMELGIPLPSRELPPNDAIEEIMDDRTLLDYVRLDFLAFGIDVAQAPAMMEINRACGYGPGREWRHFAIRREGKLVANTSLFIGAGVAGIYGVATHPEARGQGLATALVLHAMRIAQEDGYLISTLQASEMGEPVYRKIGFRTYSRIHLYEWRIPYTT